MVNERIRNAIAAVVAAVVTERVVRTAIGAVSFSAILAGIWGLWGWQWASIAGGLPFFAFYAWGEFRSAQVPPMEEG